MGYMTVSAGQVIGSAHMNLAIGQGILRFNNAAERAAAIPSPAAGMMSYLLDVNYLEVFDASITGGSNVWRVVGSLRMGHASAGISQSIPNGSNDTLLKISSVGGAANKSGRASWNANGEVTLPLSGTYLVAGDICWPANSTGERRLFIKRFTAGAWTFSGVAGGVAEINTGAVGSTLLRQQATGLIACNAGEKIGLWAQHSASSALTLAAAGQDAGSLAIVYMGGD